MITGFVLPELIIESIIRDGIMNVRADPTIIDSVFAQLTRTYNNRKYGEQEITKIKALLAKEIAVMFSYHQVDAKVPCYSIMIGGDNEDKRLAHLGDQFEEVEEQIVDADRLAALVRVPNALPTAYDPLTGKVTFDDSVDFSNLYHGLLFVDGAAVEHVIKGGIIDDLGNKSFLIDKQVEVNLVIPGEIKSSLDYDKYEIKGVTSDVSLVIGAHSKDALTTKYLYILLKYFILSRKPDLIKRNLYLASYSGSDFNRDSAYIADQVYTRFLTVTGKAEDTWRSDKVELIDNIDIECDPVE